MTATLFVFLILPSLFMDGMFADGVQYACVSKNLAEGRGSFWFPFLSATWVKAGAPYFLEQPPLMYALQSAFFKVLGDSMYTERIYTLLTALYTCIILILIWRKTGKQEYRHLSWLPVLFWLSVPLMSWTYHQNMQENTMGMFTITAIFFGLHSLTDKRTWPIYAILTGIFIFLASFTKGVPGLFPIVLSGAAWLAGRKIRFSRALLLTFIYAAVPALIYLILLQSDPGRDSLTFYFQSRLMSRVSDSPVVTSHFYIAGRLLLELLPGLFILALLLLFSKKKGLQIWIHKERMNTSLMFFILGLAGSLPLMLTLVQRGFYMSIAFPCFALSMASLACPAVLHLQEKIRTGTGTEKFLRYLFSATLTAGIVLTVVMAGRPGKNKDLLSDVYTFGEVLPEYQNISCDSAAYHFWPFQFYMLRYDNVYLKKSNRSLDYFLVKKGTVPPDSASYGKLELKTYRYDLFYRLDTGP